MSKEKTIKECIMEILETKGICSSKKILHEVKLQYINLLLKELISCIEDALNNLLRENKIGLMMMGNGGTAFYVSA